VSRLAPARDFEADDAFLHAVLGLLVLGKELEGLCDGASTIAPDQAVRSDGDLLHALLGALCMGGCVRAAIDLLAPQDEPLPRPPRVDTSIDPVKDILR
jgi:hypothetical protein